MPPGWPFFAPSSDGTVTRALDLAELAPGEHLVDLGCGDGQVLLAAAKRGAIVTGVECDEDLAASAMAALRAAGFAERSRVVVADLFTPDLLQTLAPPPTVLFSYLSPAVLQRLTPTLRGLRGVRLVTVDFALPDLVPDAGYDPAPAADPAEPDGSGGPDQPPGLDELAGFDDSDALDATDDWASPDGAAATNGSARLYRLPGRLRRPRPGQVGWSSVGTLCVMPTEVASLTCLDATAPGGPIDVKLTGSLTEHASSVTGCDSAEPGRPVAVDLRWQPRPHGTLAHGQVHVPGLEPHSLTVVYSDEDQGQWDLTDEGCTSLANHLGSASLPHPATAKDLLKILDC
jgi:SAM-dependent methyltransferase